MAGEAPPGCRAWRPTMSTGPPAGRAAVACTDSRARCPCSSAGGVEEVHAVLDEDAAAERVVPEPVAGAEVLVAGVVLEREPLRRAPAALGRSRRRAAAGCSAARGRRPGPGPAPGRVAHARAASAAVSGERLLAEHVPPGRAAPRTSGPRGCGGGVAIATTSHVLVGRAAPSRPAHTAAPCGRRGRCARGRVRVGHRGDPHAGQVGHGVRGTYAPNAPAADQAEPEVTRGSRGARSRPGDADLRVGHAVEDEQLRRRSPRSRSGRPRSGTMPALSSSVSGRQQRLGGAGEHPGGVRRVEDHRAGRVVDPLLLGSKPVGDARPETPWWISSQPSSTRIGGGPAPILSASKWNSGSATSRWSRRWTSARMSALDLVDRHVGDPDAGPRRR